MESVLCAKLFSLAMEAPFSRPTLDPAPVPPHQPEKNATPLLQNALTDRWPTIALSRFVLGVARLYRLEPAALTPEPERGEEEEKSDRRTELGGEPGAGDHDAGEKREQERRQNSGGETKPSHLPFPDHALELGLIGRPEPRRLAVSTAGRASPGSPAPRRAVGHER